MESNEVCQCLQALAQPSRIEILRLLVPLAKRRPAAGMAAGAIAQRLEMPAATLSFHLKALTQQGFLTQERRGRSIVYRADLDALVRILDALVTNICNG